MMKVNNYRHLKMDQPVYAKSLNGTEFLKRHFAGLDKTGNPMTWDSGRTSWTRQGRSVWDICITVEEYEAMISEKIRSS